MTTGDELRAKVSLLEMDDPFRKDLDAIVTKHFLSGADRLKRNQQIRTYLLFALAERFIEEQRDTRASVPDLLTLYAKSLAMNIEMVHKIDAVKKSQN